MSHTSTAPRAVADYFGRGAYTVVAQTFHPDRGWTTHVGPTLYPSGFPGRQLELWGPQYRKRITVSWARKLRAAGITTVALLCGGRLADFTITEILRTQ